MGISGGGGGGGSASQGYGYNQSLSQSKQDVWGPQATGLQGLYGGVQNLLSQQSPQAMQAVAQQQLGQVMPGAITGFNQMQQFANPNNALAQQQLADYSAQVGQNFNRQILPGIRSGAGNVAGMGGSREALARGVAAGDAAQAIAQGGTGLYAQQYGMAANAAQQLPGMAANIYNMGMSPYQAAWAPLSAAAGIYGGATTLGTSQSQGYAENWNAGKGNPQKGTYGFQLW